MNRSGHHSLENLHNNDDHNDNIENNEKCTAKRKFSNDSESNDFSENTNGIHKLKKRKRHDIDINELDEENCYIKLFFRKRPRYDIHGLCKFQEKDSDRIFCINVNIKNKINVKNLKEVIYSNQGLF